MHDSHEQHLMSSIIMHPEASSKINQMLNYQSVVHKRDAEMSSAVSDIYNVDEFVNKPEQSSECWITNLLSSTMKNWNVLRCIWNFQNFNLSDAPLIINKTILHSTRFVRKLHSDFVWMYLIFPMLMRPRIIIENQQNAKKKSQHRPRTECEIMWHNFGHVK